jgi:hypothetical protein
LTKYGPLKAFLAEKTSAEVPMRFADIEAVIDARLPPVAFKHRAWWSNNPSNSVITHAWLEAGYKTERVDMGAQRLVFRRTAPPAFERAHSPSMEGGLVARVRRALAGTVRVAEGVDLMAPTGEAWDAERP